MKRNWPKVTHPQNTTTFTFVQLPHIWIWFSYATPIAFNDGRGLVIRENDWGATTGKHLNSINPDKNIRVPGPEFEAALFDACAHPYEVLRLTADQAFKALAE